MDNLTHSMAGAVLGQMGLKRKSGLGMPTIIIAANIPDIDATCTLLGTQSLALRRGLTHGPIAMIVLPLILTALMFAFDRWQAKRGTRPAGRPPVRFLWLWLIAQIGTLSHPALDWLNSYGVRLLSPFSEQWFHGDTLFIIDVWLWALLIGGYIWARRGERAGVAPMMQRARIVFTLACAYIFANGVLSGAAEAQAADWLRGQGRAPELVVANPQPLVPWAREMLWRGEGRHGGFPYSLGAGLAVQANSAEGAANGMDDPGVALARTRDADARAFLFWSRMPVAQRADNGDLLLSDQRFSGRASPSFSVRVPAALLD
ncbi:MAG: metal-dependent hydrolase [Alphaproteobacteria bacterium]|nr:metal-dependent hydrolase [Alphaproteobacteria bacterium]MBU0795331.1 metal-dependent hydrolase [Alphaproteobacteria bacterium]MBU0877451.1 metal-dependent hydrolase [Alphaproteobacteria bacterium]MBU1770318.1 metal-dependent hydrolase [Alphaproteobacteria bacterium]